MTGAVKCLKTAKHHSRPPVLSYSMNESPSKCTNQVQVIPDHPKSYLLHRVRLKKHCFGPQQRKTFSLVLQRLTASPPQGSCMIQWAEMEEIHPEKGSRRVTEHSDRGQRYWSASAEHFADSQVKRTPSCVKVPHPQSIKTPTLCRTQDQVCAISQQLGAAQSHLFYQNLLHSLSKDEEQLCPRPCLKL